MRIALLMAVAVIAGCSGQPSGPPFPDLHPVAGVVLRGGRPGRGGGVRFTPAGGPQDFTATGDVGADGAFALATVRTDGSGSRKPGAAAGAYQVTYFAASAGQSAGYSPPVAVPKSVTVAAGPNELKIELPAKKK